MKDIPLSTSSKTHMPTFKYGIGAYVYGLLDERYIDFSGSNLTVITGYEKTSIFTDNVILPGQSKPERELILRLKEKTGYDNYRFFKNGADAVSCAIRLSREILKNNEAKIGFLGYAGSFNEYAFTINKNGIPPQNSEQINQNKENIKEFDILVYESRFEKEAKKIKSKIRICDHLKSGIVGLYEKNTADLHVYGKSLSNGYPLSVLTGKNDLILNLNNIYYSTTYGCEIHSIVKAIETIKKFDYDNWLLKYNLAKKWLPEWKSISIEKQKEYLKRGIIFNGFWQIMTCHKVKDIFELKDTIEEIGM